MVTVADEFAGSDGDIVTAAIRLLGLGPVVGTRTWGGVVGIEGYQELVDGTSITVPQYAFSFVDFGWDVENYGVDPDVEVLNTPDDWAAGRDAQLETAVQLALEALGQAAALGPPGPGHRPVQGPARAAAPPRAAAPASCGLTDGGAARSGARAPRAHARGDARRRRRRGHRQRGLQGAGAA